MPRVNGGGHLGKVTLQNMEVRRGGAQGRETGGIAFQPQTHIQEVDEGGFLCTQEAQKGVRGGLIQGAHKGALTLFLLQDAHDHHFIQGFTHSGAADPEGGGKFAFRHEALTRLDATTGDQFAQLLKDLVGYPPGLDGV